MAQQPAKSIGGRPPAQVTHIIPHQTTFTDHAGNSALMVYRGPCRSDDPSSKPLPPLFSFQVYVTSSANANDIRATDLVEKLQNTTTGEYTWRLDIYFLPSASQEDCKVHYRAEKAARDGQILGVVPSYFKLPVHMYHDVLFLVEHEDWQTKGMSVLEFGLPGPEEFEDDPDDPLLPGPELYSAGLPVAGDLPRTVGGKMYALWHANKWREEYTERYYEAVEQGKEEW